MRFGHGRLTIMLGGGGIVNREASSLLSPHFTAAISQEINPPGAKAH